MKKYLCILMLCFIFSCFQYRTEMKKYLCILMLTIIMTFGGVCSASDGSDLNSEQKTAQLFFDVFKGENVPEYSVLSRDFADSLKTQFTQANYNGLQRNTKNNFGTLTESRFFAYQRYDKSDVVVYYVVFDSNKMAQIVFTFDKDKKLVNVSMAEVNMQQNNK